MFFSVLHSFFGIIEVEVIIFFFFTFFLFGEKNKEASRVDQRRPGWSEAGFLLLRREGRRLEIKERKKEGHPNRKALELLGGVQE